MATDPDAVAAASTKEPTSSSTDEYSTQKMIEELADTIYKRKAKDNICLITAAHDTPPASDADTEAQSQPRWRAALICNKEGGGTKLAARPPRSQKTRMDVMKEQQRIVEEEASDFMDENLEKWCRTWNCEHKDEKEIWLGKAQDGTLQLLNEEGVEEYKPIDLSTRPYAAIHAPGEKRKSGATDDIDDGNGGGGSAGGSKKKAKRNRTQSMPPPPKAKGNGAAEAAVPERSASDTAHTAGMTAEEEFEHRIKAAAAEASGDQGSRQTRPKRKKSLKGTAKEPAKDKPSGTTTAGKTPVLQKPSEKKLADDSDACSTLSSPRSIDSPIDLTEEPYKSESGDSEPKESENPKQGQEKGKASNASKALGQQGASKPAPEKKNTCRQCRLKHKKCDGQRPCQYCKDKGVDDRCRDP